MTLLADTFRVTYQILSVVTPVLNYLPQYNLMSKTRSVGSFSPRICTLLLLSNLSRIVFW